MNWFRVPMVLKYFLGIALVQGVTALLMYAWWRSASTDAGLTFAALALATGFFAALWFSTLARGDKKEALMRAEATLSRERERHKLLTERERAKAIEKARKQVSRESGRIQTRANVKVGAAVAGMVGVGAVLLLTQFLSLGVLLISSSGGALAGYLWRARQELRRRVSNGAEAAPKMTYGTRLIGGGDSQGRPPVEPPKDHHP